MLYCALFLISTLVTTSLVKKSRRKPAKFHIFVINLSRSKDRLDNFKKYYKELVRPIPLTRVEAVDKRKIVNTPMIKKWDETITLNPQFKSKEEFEQFVRNNIGSKAVQLSYVKSLKIAKNKRKSRNIMN